jgi:uncharacterized membrane protein YbaN (DUF454 family)
MAPEALLKDLGDLPVASDAGGCQGWSMATDPQRSNIVVRSLWSAAGLLAVALGAIGIIVPGLPTTAFFILAAWCFSKSSPRLEQWVLGLRGIGPMVTDYRSGLGMARRAKAWAIGMMVLAGSLSIIFAIDSTVVRVIIAAAVVTGVWFVGLRVPTRETELARRATAGGSSAPSGPVGEP